ncbi:MULTISPECIES: SDR family NAD(P)-dependent oxidoreductase [unclassified Mycobacterium]|uniref:SDR family NAD(P)-dependent oxidoreductase n=1 Tax=unclassified Mycobacterium TaxID=2642494 RepID=UPI0029C861DC|nr:MULTISPECIES: SDR family NAD(P)-dependent oxidoreductase [unclassified Mycobacterium]
MRALPAEVDVVIDGQVARAGGDDGGRVVVVTGASSGIGLATAEQLALSGHRVVLGARRTEVCEEVAAKLRVRGASAVAIALDLADESSISRFVSRVQDDLGPVDVLVSNAGNSFPDPSTNTDQARLRESLAVNFMGPQHLVSHALPAMIEAGRGDLVFVSSQVVGGVPRRWMSAYSASKHALEAWIDVLQAELEGTGVRSSVVRPGPTRTEQGTNWSAEEMQLMMSGWHGQSGVRNTEALQPEDVAQVIASVVELPENVHMKLVEVVPSIPRKAAAQG